MESIDENDTLENILVEGSDCILCNESLENTKQVSLECNHICHLRCLLINSCAYYQSDVPFRCTQCEKTVIQEDIYNEIQTKADMLYNTRHSENNSQDEINKLMETSEEFRNDMAEYRQKHKEYNKQNNIFMKIIREEKKRYNEQIKNILMILKGTYNSTINKINSTEEFKCIKKLSRKFLNYEDKLCKKYDIRKNILYTANFGRNNLFRNTIRYSTYKYYLRRIFSIHIR